MTLNKIKDESTNVCNLKYLSEMMGGKNHLIAGIIDAFLVQVPEELAAIEEAIEKENYPVIKSFAHTMKSSVSIMGITVLTPILQEIENLSLKAEGMAKISELFSSLTQICKKAVEEIEIERKTFI